MKTIKILSIFLLGLFLVACEQNEQSSPCFCKNAKAESYSSTFKAYMTGVKDQPVPLKYTCPPTGQGVSPPISWEGVPKEATRLHIVVEDATCTYMCNSACKYHHWQLDVPLNDDSFSFTKGFPEGASKNKELQRYVLPNSSNKHEYMPFCPPKDQIHAIVVQLTAYHMEEGKKVIDGRSQSRPYLISLKPMK